MKLIDGKKISEDIKNELAEKVRLMQSSGKRPPHLAAILVGNDGASETYVNNKQKACNQIGYNSTIIRYPDTITESQLIEKIIEINNNSDIDGLIVQLPLPKHISETKIIETIDYRKDVDGFHPINLGRMMLGMPAFISATPWGIVELISRMNISINGKKCVVIGRSNIVGTPVSILLSRKGNPGNATVTLCHSYSENIAEITQNADLIIAAIGKPGFITAPMVKQGAVVIDVGTTRVPCNNTKTGYKLYGDVAFDEVAPKCSFITPVPGGVGLMTIAGLLVNTMKAATKQIY